MQETKPAHVIAIRRVRDSLNECARLGTSSRKVAMRLVMAERELRTIREAMAADRRAAIAKQAAEVPRPADYAEWASVKLSGFISHGIFDDRGREVGTMWMVTPAYGAAEWSVSCQGGRDGGDYGGTKPGTRVARLDGAAFDVIARKASAAHKRSRLKWIATGDGSAVRDG
jgi:hypothetical protein